MVEQFETAIGPFQLVRLIANREVEPPQAAAYCIGEQLAQMQRARTVLRDRRGIVVTRQHVVIAIAENDGEVRCHQCTADFDAADVKLVPQICV